MLPEPMHRDHGRWSLALASVLIAAIAFPAQGAEAVHRWAATSARPYVLRGSERRLLDRAERFLADEQWDDAVEALMRLLEPDNFSVVAVGDQHYVSLQVYCHRLLARLPAEPLARYRTLVDAAAESWYRQGIAERDPLLLQRVVDKYFCSHWGDDALFALGELALQRGDYLRARGAWSRIGGKKDPTADRLAYPDTDLSLPTVQASLVLAAIREDDWQRAEAELARLRTDYPTARGRLGGREVVLSDRLAGLLEQARQWLSQPTSNEWRTFAASPQRTNSLDAPNPSGPYELVWSQPIANEQLSIFPIVVNGLVIYQDDTSVHALNLTDGQQAFWAQGRVFRSPVLSVGWLGQSFHTLTANDRFLFGVTTAPLGQRRKSVGADARSTLWSLDLDRDGALALNQPSEKPGIGFVGAPVVDDSRAWVPIRSNDQTARVGIACYDLSTGELSWQRWLCQANSPASGWTNEVADNLLSYDSGVIYANTNLGAVAAVRAEDGLVLWLHTYERRSATIESTGECAYYRGPNSCVYYRGVVYVLPTDGNFLLAIDAATGAVLWRYAVDDPAARLLGVIDDRVALSNNGLQVLEGRTGKLAGENAVGAISGWAALRIRAPHGEILMSRSDFRGAMINSFDVREAGTHYDGFELPEPGGANLLLSDNYLVAAGPTQLSVFRYQSRVTNSPQNTQEPSTE